MFALPSIRRILILLVLLPIAPVACAGPIQLTSNHEITAGSVTITDPWARPAPQPGTNSAVYGVILNGLDDPIRLTGASTSVAGAVETHESSSEGDVMRMVHHPEGFEIESGKPLVLEPGGKHMMLIDLKEALVPGATIEIELTFEGTAPIRLMVPVAEPGN